MVRQEEPPGVSWAEAGPRVRRSDELRRRVARAAEVPAQVPRGCALRGGARGAVALHLTPLAGRSWTVSGCCGCMTLLRVRCSSGRVERRGTAGAALCCEGTARRPAAPGSQRRLRLEFPTWSSCSRGCATSRVLRIRRRLRRGGLPRRPAACAAGTGRWSPFRAGRRRRGAAAAQEPPRSGGDPPSAMGVPRHWRRESFQEREGVAGRLLLGGWRSRVRLGDGSRDRLRGVATSGLRWDRRTSRPRFPGRWRRCGCAERAHVVGVFRVRVEGSGRGWRDVVEIEAESDHVSGQSTDAALRGREELLVCLEVPLRQTSEFLGGHPQKDLHVGSEALSSVGQLGERPGDDCSADGVL